MNWKLVQRFSSYPGTEEMETVNSLELLIKSVWPPQLSESISCANQSKSVGREKAVCLDRFTFEELRWRAPGFQQLWLTHPAPLELWKQHFLWNQPHNFKIMLTFMYRWIQFFQSKISQVCLDPHANFDFKLLGNHSVDLNTSSEFVCLFFIAGAKNWINHTY